jgi:endonuclease YncB( thermonuclease family)
MKLKPRMGFKRLGLLITLIALLSSSLHAQQTTTVVRVVDGDTLKVRYWGIIR